MHLLLAPILFGLGAMAIPVVIHLLHRQKTTPIAWGAMQFLVPSKLQAKKRKKVEHWLLMLLRIAALAVLVFLLARPVWRADAFKPAGGGAATDFAVVIDHSLSTGRRGAGPQEPGTPQSILDRSVAAVNEIAGKLRPADTLTVVLAGHKPRILTDRPLSGSSAELAKLRDALAQLKPGLGDADLPAAVQAAREVAGHGRNLGKRIIVLGDEQRSGWQVENATAWNSAIGRSDGAEKPGGVFSVAFAPDPTVANVAVTRLDVRPSVIGPGRAVEITATLASAGSTPLARLPVKLVVDGKPAGSQVVDELPGGSSRTVRFEQTFKEAGSHWAKVSVDIVDGLEADNSAVVAVNVLAKLPVLLIDNQLTSAGPFRSSQFLAAAMEPVDAAAGETSLIRTQIVGASDAPLLNLNDYAAVVVNDAPQLPAETLGRLADYARAGHGVWIVLGPHSQAEGIAGRLADSGLFVADVGGPAKVGTKEVALPGVVVSDPANPMVAPLTAADRNGMAGVTTTGWWAVKPTEADERVVLATTTGDPLVLERAIGSRGGRVVVWATGADGAWNNWPLSPSFVPLVQETVLHLAGGAVGARSGSTEAGKPLLWTGPLLPPVLSVSIARPDGVSTAPLRISLESRRFATRYDDTFVPGLYELRFSPSDVPQPVYYGVGIDPRETESATLTDSDFRSMKEAGFLTARVPPEKIFTILSAGDRGTELWPMLAIAVLGILVLETAVTYRMVRFQATENVNV